VNAERTDLVTVLSKTALLAGLSQPELQALGARTVRKIFTMGELLFSEGEPCAGLYIISRGKVRIFKTSTGGREQVLAVNVPGESVAELPVFDGGPYPASGSRNREHGKWRSFLVAISRLIAWSIPKSH
jgi:CRP/FNR family transcriptional regulator